MKCDYALDTIYGEEDTPHLGKRLALAFHIIFCNKCASHLEKYEEARSVLETAFFPPSPDFSDSIMNHIYSESLDDEVNEQFNEAGRLSVKSWVIAGIALVLSLATVFFGQDFTNIARESKLKIFDAG